MRGESYFSNVVCLFRPSKVVAWSVVNVTAEVKYIRLIYLDTNRVSREEVCLPSFEVVNCRLK